jgi:hypothetical protein
MFARRDEPVEYLEDVEDARVLLPATGLLMSHRMARKPTKATAMSWGMLIDV